jgi:hypothetical protein
MGKKWEKVKIGKKGEKMKLLDYLKTKEHRTEQYKRGWIVSPNRSKKNKESESVGDV